MLRSNLMMRNLPLSIIHCSNPLKKALQNWQNSIGNQFQIPVIGITEATARQL